MIKVINLTKCVIDEQFLKRVAKKVLKGENRKEMGLSVVLVEEKRIRKLNRKYRAKDKITDVLAFSGNSELRAQNSKFIFPENKKEELGEVVICLQKVRKNAKRYSSTFEQELTRVLIHGILHLLGYEHEKFEKGAQEMERRQEYYLSQIK